MRIVAGTLKGKILKSPKDDQTRPTSDAARESLFNILASRLFKSEQRWDKLTFLDAFAGTGAVGIEAISRGVSKAYFMENYLPALEVLKENTRGIDRAVVMSVDATVPPQTLNPVDIVFIDAPYTKHLWERALEGLKKSRWADEKTVLVVEVERAEEIVLPGGFELIDDRSYGRNRLLFLKLV